MQAMTAETPFPIVAERRRPAPVHTVSAGGFSAIADAFAVDSNDGLWFLSMVGSQTALKAIWGALLKQPPDAAWLIEGTEGAFVGDYRSCYVPHETIGTWSTHLSRLSASGAYHAMVYPRLAELGFEREDFLLVARAEDEAQILHYRFLDRRTPLPLYAGWSDWLWRRGLRTGEVEALQTQGIFAFRCRPDQAALRVEMTRAVQAGELIVPKDDHTSTNGHSNGNPAIGPKGGAK